MVSGVCECFILTPPKRHSKCVEFPAEKRRFRWPDTPGYDIIEKIYMTGATRMDDQQMLDTKTIRAAVAGEKWATEKVLAYYEDYINELSTVEVRQTDGSVKK